MTKTRPLGKSTTSADEPSDGGRPDGDEVSDSGDMSGADHGNEPGRLMALDIGDRRIGVAISDPLQVVARPLLVVERRGRAPDLERIAGLVREWNARSVIVGWPLMPSGDRGDQARTVEAFVRRLRRTLSVPIHLWDESYTTREAEARLRGRGIGWRAAKSVVDAEAAAVILEEWMREHGGIDERRTPDTAKGDSLGST